MLPAHTTRIVAAMGSASDVPAVLEVMIRAETTMESCGRTKEVR